VSAMATDRVILFTQCLQNDFVRKLAPTEPLPNLLHVGREESRRLLGEDPAEGPLARFLDAFAEGGRHLSVHIRDWHSGEDLAQRAHLEHFGTHCVRDTAGARFIPPLEALIAGRGRGAIVIDSPGLSDFEGTPLAAVLQERIGASDLPRAKAGIVGVWTDVKVQYLAYELATRLGIEQIAVSSALVASRSRARHRAALEHLREMLGVIVFDSTPEFLDWLEVDATAASAPARVTRRSGRRSKVSCPTSSATHGASR
jgi:nicotinamidase-related amidase